MGNSLTIQSFQLYSLLILPGVSDNLRLETLQAKSQLTSTKVYWPYARSSQPWLSRKTATRDTCHTVTQSSLVYSGSPWEAIVSPWCLPVWILVMPRSRKICQLWAMHLKPRSFRINRSKMKTQKPGRLRNLRGKLSSWQKSSQMQMKQSNGWALWQDRTRTSLWDAQVHLGSL